MMDQFQDNPDCSMAEELSAAWALMEKYRGRMPIEQLSEGIKACLKNARGLVFEAELLLKNQRFARAMSLAMTALEELGKVRVLKSMVRIPKTNQKLWADRWNLFVSHESKTSYAFVDTLPDEAYLFPDLVVSAAEDNASMATLGERVRQVGLYVDWFPKEDRWLNPVDEVTREAAASRIGIAKAGLARLDSLCRQGWFSVAVLKVEHEIMSPMNDGMPKLASIVPEDLQRVGPTVQAKLREFFQDVIERGLVHLPEDFTIQGIPLKQFLEGNDQQA